MNVNKRKLIEEIYGLSFNPDTMSRRKIEKVIENCENEKDELKRLFIGAPVMLWYPMLNDNKGDWKIENYFNQKSATTQLRLPTFEEAPRNVWLAPWLTYNEDIVGNYILIRYNKGQVINNPSIITLGRDWDRLEAIMICEDFKNEKEVC